MKEQLCNKVENVVAEGEIANYEPAVCQKAFMGNRQDKMNFTRTLNNSDYCN